MITDSRNENTCSRLETRFLSLELDGAYPKKSNERRHFHGNAVCRHGKRVYIHLAELLEKMVLAGEQVGGRARLLNRLSKYPLLIIDEWAARTIRSDEAHFLFDLVERRYGNSSMLLCTQHPMREWHALLGGDATADSIMDRLVQNAIHVNTGETNMRQLLSPHPLRPEDNP